MTNLTTTAKICQHEGGGWWYFPTKIIQKMGKRSDAAHGQVFFPITVVVFRNPIQMNLF